MREALLANSEISLCRQNGEKRQFVIKEIVGEGAGCIVYEAYMRLHTFGPDKRVRLKECFPIRYAREMRGAEGICWESDEAKQEAFSQFEQLYQRQMYWQEQYEFVNVSSHIIDSIYTGNNTMYLVIDIDETQTFDKAEIKDLQSLLKMIKALAVTVGKYHNLNLLHLDIKPQNFTVVPETPELIKLIDFDSFISMANVKQGIIRGLSYTNVWAAPEVKQGRWRQIGPVSDVYAIGAVLFYGLFRRNMEPEDRLLLDTMRLEGHPLLKRLNPAVEHKLIGFMQKCLAASTKIRFQNMNKVCEKLDELIALADPQALYLCSSIPEQLSYFAGREKELQQVYHLLKQQKMVLINGIGGIGKSEFAKRYAYEFRDEYTQVVWLKWKDNIRNLFLEKNGIVIANYSEDVDADDAQKAFDRKLEVLKGLVTPKTLIIIDDVRDFKDKDLGEVLKLDCKFLFTTRKNLKDLFAKEKIFTLGCMEPQVLERIFLQHYSLALSEEEKQKLPELFDEAGNYTLLIPIMAKQMQIREWTPSQMLKRLKEDGMQKASKDHIPGIKDDEWVDEIMYNHVRRLFTLSELDDSQKKVLGILSWLEPLHVKQKQLMEWCETDDYGIVRSLVEDGWLYHDERLNLISIHNVIADIVNEELALSIEEVPGLWEAATEWDVEYVMDVSGPKRTVLAEKLLEHLNLSVQDNVVKMLEISNKYYLTGYLYRLQDWAAREPEVCAGTAAVEIKCLLWDLDSPWRDPWGNPLEDDSQMEEELLLCIQKAIKAAREVSEWKIYQSFEDYWTKVLELNKYNAFLKHCLLYYSWERGMPESMQLIREITQAIADGSQDELTVKRAKFFLNYWRDSNEVSTETSESLAELGLDIYDMRIFGEDTTYLEWLFDDVTSKNEGVGNLNSFPGREGAEDDFLRIPEEIGVLPFDDFPFREESEEEKVAKRRREQLLNVYRIQLTEVTRNKRKINSVMKSMLTFLAKQEIIELLFEEMRREPEMREQYKLFYLDLCEKEIWRKLTEYDFAKVKLWKLSVFWRMHCYRKALKELTEFMEMYARLCCDKQYDLHKLEPVIKEFGDFFMTENWYAMAAYFYKILFDRIPEKAERVWGLYNYAINQLLVCAQELGCRELLYAALEQKLEYAGNSVVDVKLQTEDRVSVEVLNSVECHIGEIVGATSEMRLEQIKESLNAPTELDEKSIFYLSKACEKENDCQRFMLQGKYYVPYVGQDKQVLLHLESFDIYACTEDIPPF